MNAAATKRAEELIRDAWSRGDMNASVEHAYTAFGPEIRGYLLRMLHDEHDAKDVYSDFAEDVFRGMPGFRFDSSVRTWLYTLAHHAYVRHVKREQRRRGSPLPDSDDLPAPSRERSPTPAYARTSVREGVERLRSKLKPSEQTLLILRIDRKLTWDEIARVLAGPGATLGDAELCTRTSRLRKQFERLKERLRALAVEERILGENEHG